MPRLYENCESAGLKEPELSEKAGCFRVNMFRNTELIQAKPEEVWDKSSIREKNQGETKEKNQGETRKKNQGENGEKRNRKKEQKKGTEKRNRKKEQK